jgi:DNA-binding response OmpR family regulator
MLRILLVDDEPLVTEELQEALEFEGYEVSAAGSVNDALAVFDAETFDLVITDLKMPRVTGLDLLRALRERSAPPRVIVLSGHGAESNKIEATALGAAACLAKPVDADRLIAEIEAVCS